MSDRSNSSARSRPPPSDFRFLGRTFDRLTVRLAAGIALLMIVPLGFGFYALSEHHFDQTVAARQRAGELQTRILEAALRHQMVDQDTTLMTAILHEIGEQPSVRSAMILNHDGEVRIASDPALVGQVMSRDSPSCVVCHSKEREQREQWTVTDAGGEEVLRSVLPVENRAECFSCHSPETRLNGILILDTSLADLRAELRQDTFYFIVGTSFLGIFLFGGVGLFARRLILARLQRLGGTARSIAAGDLKQRATLEGDDVITALAWDFNSMADTVDALVTEVREQEAQLVSIMDSLDDGLIVLDASSRIVAANRSFCRRVGTHPEVLRGLRCHDTVGDVLPCCSSGAACPAERCMASGEVQRAVFHSPASDGRRSLVEEVHASPVYDQDGNVVQIVEIWRNITERVEEEQRLAEIEHLVSLGTLASGFSHEVNTPLASMLTCAESVLGQLDDYDADVQPQEQLLLSIRDCASVIRDQVLRCQKITEQFLRFSRGIPPSNEPVDLLQVVTGVVALVEGTARDVHVQIEVERDGALPGIRANAEVVQHALLNLLVNALQSFEQAGGTVVVQFEVGEQVHVRVRDDGAGIAPENRLHLFEPFNTHKPGGTGLGLFLSRSFMRRFGGDVRLVHTAVGRGSCFEILFARATEDDHES